MLKTILTFVLVVAFVAIAAPQVVPHIGTYVQSCVDVIANGTHTIVDYILNAGSGNATKTVVTKGAELCTV